MKHTFLEGKNINLSNFSPANRKQKHIHAKSRNESQQTERENNGNSTLVQKQLKKTEKRNRVTRKKRVYF